MEKPLLHIRLHNLTTYPEYGGQQVSENDGSSRNEKNIRFFESFWLFAPTLLNGLNLKPVNSRHRMKAVGENLKGSGGFHIVVFEAGCRTGKHTSGYRFRAATLYRPRRVMLRTIGAAFVRYFNGALLAKGFSASMVSRFQSAGTKACRVSACTG